MLWAGKRLVAPRSEMIDLTTFSGGYSNEGPVRRAPATADSYRSCPNTGANLVRNFASTRGPGVGFGLSHRRRLRSGPLRARRPSAPPPHYRDKPRAGLKPGSGRGARCAFFAPFHNFGLKGPGCCVSNSVFARQTHGAQSHPFPSLAPWDVVSARRSRYGFPTIFGAVIRGRLYGLGS